MSPSRHLLLLVALAALPSTSANAHDDVIVAEAPPSGAVSVSRLIESGAPELVLQSAAYGGVAGFLGVATALSATRISEVDSLPWLVGAPAFGILAGGALASAAAYGLPLDAGDAALFSSTLWIGTGWGLGLQLLVFDQRDDIGHIPLRFATVLGSGLGLGALGAAAAWGLEVDPGDVGVMNSAALWGPVLAGLGWFTLGTSGLISLEPGSPIGTFSTFVSILLASSILPWTATFALHPFLSVERPATWLIEAGGVTGLFGGLALMTMFLPASLPQGVYPAMVTSTTALGVAGGAVLAYVLSDALSGIEVADFTTPLLSPALLPPVPGRDDLAPALFATVRF